MANSNILERNINRFKGVEVNFSTISFLFAEYINYCKTKVNGIHELEVKISDLGKEVGARLYELVLWREKSSKREHQFLNILIYVTNNFWKLVAGKTADSLERNTERENEYMIFDNDPLICKYISTPKELQSLNCSIIYGGMVESILSNSGHKCSVSAHQVPTAEFPNRVVFLVKLDSI